MNNRFIRRAAAVGGSTCLSLGVLAALPGTAGAAGSTLFVSPTGTAGGSDISCSAAGYSTISSAVQAAASGDTIEVCAGTYKEAVAIRDKAVTLTAAAGAAPVIDAAGAKSADGPQGITISSAASAGTVVSGLTVQHATREGILVQGTSNVQLLNNSVLDNDLMCQPQTSQDDCGEGIDLEAVTNSTVSGNTVEHNSGGILLSDGIPAGSIGATAFGATTEFSGPTSGNQVLNNTVMYNVWDCGITLPGHNSNAVVNGAPAPGAGGVFNNTVKGNTSNYNGTSGGGGAGLLVAAPFPGTGSYDNTFEGNTVTGNGQAGITVHSHAPGQDVNGNQFIANTIGANAVGETVPGTGVYSTGTTAGDADAGDPATTGILLYSAVQPITGTRITGNIISGNFYGIWTENTLTNGISGNIFSKVTKAAFVSPRPGSGYLMGAADGGVFNFGAVPFEGSATGLTSGSPVVGVAGTPDSGGYWIATADGGVFSFGDAAFYGSLGGVHLNRPIVGIAATPDGHGYWLVASDGGVFSFGNAAFHGSLGAAEPAHPVVGIAATPDGGGYWLVASDGGVFSFGDAAFHGSTGNMRLAAPVVSMAADPTGGGYWLVASDGGVFSFGDAAFHGSAGAVRLNRPVVAMAAQPDGSGYWLFASDGGVFNYGTAGFFGSTAATPLAAAVVAGQQAR